MAGCSVLRTGPPRMGSVCAEEMGVPEYSSERSRRTYGDRTEMGLPVPKQYPDVSYRELCSMFPSLKLRKGKVPDHSAPVKFPKNADAEITDGMLRRIAHMLCGDDMTVTVDSTGFSYPNASGHYVKRIMEMNMEMGREIIYSNAAVRGFSKASLAVDTDTKAVLTCDRVYSNHADVKRMEYLVADHAEGDSAYRMLLPIRGMMPSTSM